jgi:ribulose 1,5-bisphosphate carboxylase large subunit-like protein
MAFTFQGGQVLVEDDELSGQPSTSKMTENVEKIRELIHKDHHQTVHQVKDTVGISYGVCKDILTENLNIRRPAPSSLQRAHPHVLENHTVCD